MKVVFSSRAWADYLWWQGQPKGLDRINALIEECRRHPFRGTGKPEPLRGDLSGFWSRRINEEHRLVYEVSGRDADQALFIAQLRYHY